MILKSLCILHCPAFLLFTLLTFLGKTTDDPTSLFLLIWEGRTRTLEDPALVCSLPYNAFYFCPWAVSFVFFTVIEKKIMFLHTFLLAPKSAHPRMSIISTHNFHRPSTGYKYFTPLTLIIFFLWFSSTIFTVNSLLLFSLLSNTRNWNRNPDDVLL